MKTLLIATLLLSPAAFLPPSAPEPVTDLSQSAAQDASQDATQDPYRQFDFWVGSWRCETQDGNLAGTNTITLECGNKVLQENWKGASGGVGKSLNIYDAAQKKWHQTWVDQFGTLLLLDGELDAEGSMVLRGERPGKDGKTVKHQIKWTPKGEQVRQTWTFSTDDGKTWTTAADLNYIPAKVEAPKKE